MSTPTGRNWCLKVHKEADFATLFQGGGIATDSKDEFRPLEVPDGSRPEAVGAGFTEMCAAHLNDPGEGIGVYPLRKIGEEYVVHWGCVDFDDGEEDSLAFALNLELVLNRLGVKGWVERSRSKGYHLWVFFTEPVLARFVREGLIAACHVVDAPIKEVNPKQIELTGKGWGNGVRLPFPAGREKGRNTVVSGSVDMDPETFINAAMQSRVTPEDWKPVRALYRAPAPPPARNVYQYGGGTMAGLAGAIRRGGPRTSKDKPHGDRSSTLFNLACAMVRQGYDNNAILRELESADEDWGGKYAKRPDGRQRLWETVIKASKVAMQPKP